MLPSSSTAPSRKRQDGIRTLQGIKDRCRVDDITGCWLWADAKHKGTAVVWMPGIGVLSMTAALQALQHGTRPTGKRMLVPTCGNSSCGNPEHRRWGTRSDLFALVMGRKTPDQLARCTAARRAVSTVCTPELAAEIRASDEPVADIAKRIGVHVTHVYRIKRGEAWAPAANGASVFSWRPAA